MAGFIRSKILCLPLTLAALFTVCTALAVPVSIETSTDIVKTFDTVQPQILGTRHSRDVHPASLDIQITNSAGETFTLQLTLNDKLIAPGFASVYYYEDGREIKVTDQVNCFYHGKVLEHPEWKVAMDSCQGLRGSFGDWSNKTQQYHIEPLSKKDSSLEQPHALYQSDPNEQEGECGTTHEHYHKSVSINTEDLDRAKRQSVGDHFIEVAIVSDQAQFQYYGNPTDTVNRAIAIINAVDLIFSEENVRVVLVQSIIWSSGDSVTFDPVPNLALENFRFHAASLQLNSDTTFLLTGNDFNGNTVGIAYLNTMCSSASVGVVQDRHSSAAATGSIFAHEIGHLLNMTHDTSICSCNDPSGRCVMAAVSSIPAPQQWSSCSVSTLQLAVSSTLGIGRCLTNEPTSLVGDPVCGNGIREEGEICDCGSEEDCDDPCCDASTCKLAAGAQCSRGECCSSTCQFLTSDTVCRGSTGECDIAERCNGQSAECPANVYVQDASTCNDGQDYCFAGQCNSYDSQCQRHFGTNKGFDECFSFNTRGDIFGNCGSDGTNFVPCSSSNVMCGQLYCQLGTYQNLVNSVTILDVGVFIPSLQSVQHCNAFTIDASSDILSPGLVEDGIKCGPESLCYEQRCVPVSSLSIPQCPTGTNGLVCSGNGVCNNRGECSCNAGYSGTTCEPSELCGGRLSNVSGSFQTPGWPSSYPVEDFECEWIIDIPMTGYAVEFTIDDSAYGIKGRSPCSTDHIEFFNGINASEASLHKLCRFDNPGPIETSTSQARVVFTGSSRRRHPSRVGVRVTYTAIDIDECALGTHGCEHQCQNTEGSYICSCNSGYSLNSDGLGCTPNTVQPTETTNCGGILTGSQGSFETDGWPNSYLNQDFQCEWIIQTPPGMNRIYFYFDASAFGVNGQDPCTNDHIEFFDGTDAEAPSISKICGARNDFGDLPTVLTTTSQARVVFTGSNDPRPNDRVGVKVYYISF